MSLLSLEDLAEKWTLAHTIAVAAWIVVFVLGIILLFRSGADTYPSTDRLKIYAAENATFTYPANWIINDCSPDKSFIELPGTIKSDYKGKKDDKLTIYGDAAVRCIKDRPQRLDIYSEDMKASTSPCAPGTSTEGDKLDNGLYFQLQELDGEVYAIHIKQNSCYAPAETVVLGFAFIDSKANPDDQLEFGAPRVKKQEFLKSRQYQDIRKLAESIKY